LPFVLSAGDIFYSEGNDFGVSQGKRPTREPYEIVDTLTLQNGVGTVILNPHFTSQLHSTKPTDASNIFPSITQILSDTSETVYYYALYISTNLETLIVKSSNSSDDSHIRIRVLMR